MGRRIVSGFVVACVAVAVAAAARQAPAQGQLATAVHLSASELGWVPLAPDIPIQMVPLWGDRSRPGEYGMFLKLPADSEAGLHAHTGDYHGINIQGTWMRTIEGDPVEKELPPGSYVFQPGRQFHNDRCTHARLHRCKGPEDCVLFIHQHSMGDLLTPPAAR